MRTTFCETKGSDVDLLPLEVDGDRVHVGPLRRAVALVVDALVLSPLAALQHWTAGVNPALAVTAAIMSLILAFAYHVTFNAKLGATPGKMALKIAITRLDGTRIGWPESLKRSSVEFILALALLVLGIPWIWNMYDAQLAQLHADAARTAFRKAHVPGAYSWVSNAQVLWVYADIAAILLNPRKRALHDFIAGTIVINERFAEQAHRADAVS